MAINYNTLRAGALAAGTVAGMAVGAALGKAQIKAASKIIGKPVGVRGSYAHVMTNDKLDKQAYKKAVKKEYGKDLGKAFGFAGIAGGAAAGIAKLTQVSKPVGEFFAKGKESAAQVLKELPANVKDLRGKTAETVKEIGLVKRINSLPKPVKAAILAGGAALAAVLPIVAHKANVDSAYYEAKYETK